MDVARKRRSERRIWSKATLSSCFPVVPVWPEVAQSVFSAKLSSNPVSATFMIYFLGGVKNCQPQCLLAAESIFDLFEHKTDRLEKSDKPRRLLHFNKTLRNRPLSCNWKEMWPPSIVRRLEKNSKDIHFFAEPFQRSSRNSQKQPTIVCKIILFLSHCCE